MSPPRLSTESRAIELPAPAEWLSRLVAPAANPIAPHTPFSSAGANETWWCVPDLPASGPNHLRRRTGGQYRRATIAGSADTDTARTPQVRVILMALVSY